MQLEGTILEIQETKTYGESGFRKREFVVETDEQYSQKIPLEMVQDKCDILNNYNIGQKVKVSINIRANEWVNPQGVTKRFISLQGWRIEKLSDNNHAAQQFEPAPDLSSNEPENLPF